MLRENYPIDIDKKIILLVATHLDRKYKGFHKFIEAISYLDPKDIEIVTFGEISKKALNKINNFSVTNLGIISSSKKLSSIYSSSYLFAAPSILEAFGKTIGESMLCGTPCVVFGNSGPSELIIHKYTGYVANNTCPKSFAEGLKWLLNLDQKKYEKISINCINHAKANYDPAIAAEKYYQNYKLLKVPPFNKI